MKRVALGAAIIAGCCSSSAYAVTILATANIYRLAGSTVGTDPFSMAVVGGSSITFSASGAIVFNNGSGNNSNDADGIGSASAINVSSLGDFSGFKAPNAGSLVGFFYDPRTALVGPPATLDFTTIGTGFTSLSPRLNQVFFIGDGLTGDGTGEVQTFTAPTRATMLYIGFADAPGYNGAPGAYDDNSGSLSVTINAPSATVPEPATWAMMFAGFGGIGYAMRRNRKAAVRFS